MYSSHPAKEKLFTRTQREAHSLQFEKIYTGMYSSHPAKEKFTRTNRPLNLEALKIGSWKLKNLEISVKIWRLTIIYTLGGYEKKSGSFSV